MSSIKKQINSAFGTLSEFAEISNQTIHETVTLLSTTNYSDFLSLVDSTMHKAINDMQDGKAQFSKYGEDPLTLSLLMAFKAKGFEATHDSEVGGHCDIIISKNNFQWLGEAKVHSDYDWLLKGYRQLLFRYSPGANHSLYGGMVIYNKNKDAVSVVEEWSKYLCEHEEILHLDNHDNLNFSTIQKHPSGNNYQVKHYSVLLHHEPQDTKK